MTESLLEVEQRLGIEDYTASIDSVGIIDDPDLAQEIAQAFVSPHQRAVLMGEKAAQLDPAGSPDYITMTAKDMLPELEREGFTKPTEYDADLELLFQEAPVLKARYEAGPVRVPWDLHKQASSDEERAKLFYRCRLFTLFQGAQDWYERQAEWASTIVYFRHIAAQNLARYRTVLTDQDIELFGPSMAVVENIATHGYNDETKRLDRNNQALRCTLKMKQDVLGLARLLGRDEDDVLAGLSRHQVARVVQAIEAFGVLPPLIAHRPEDLPTYFQSVYKDYE